MTAFFSSPRRTLVTGLTSLAIAGALFVPLAAQARGPGDDGKRVDKVCKELSCTSQQRSEIKQVFEQMRIDVKTDRQTIRTLRKQLADEWVKDRPDEAAMAKLHDQIAAHERNIADRRHDAMMELHALLSADQRVKFAESMGKKGKRGKKNRNKNQKADSAD